MSFFHFVFQSRAMYIAWVLLPVAIQPCLTAILLKDIFHGCSVDNMFDYMSAFTDTEIRDLSQHI